MSYYFKLVYKIKENNGGKNEFTRIFDGDFVERNRNKYKIIYNNKEYPLKEYFEEIDKNCEPGKKIKFKLRFLHNILDLYGMFYNCINLISIKDDTKVKEKRISNKTNYGRSIYLKK